DVHLGHESAVDVAAIRTALATLRHRLTIAAVEAEGRTAAATLRSARDRADPLLGRLQRGDAELASRLAQVQASLRDDFAAKLDTLQDNLAPRHVTVRELPPDLTRKFIGASGRLRSEEHTSELQSRFDLVCRLLLEKKKKKTQPSHIQPQPDTD